MGSAWYDFLPHLTLGLSTSTLSLAIHLTRIIQNRARKSSLVSAFPADPRPAIRDLGVCFYLPLEYRHSVEPVPPPTALQWVWLGTPISTSTLVLAVHKGDKLQLNQSSTDTEFCFLRRATPIYSRLGRLLSHPPRYLQGSPDGS